MSWPSASVRKSQTNGRMRSSSSPRVSMYNVTGDDPDTRSSMRKSLRLVFLAATGSR
jgi:hypothetical protein